VGITIWYPAVPAADAGSGPVENAEPDFSGAPYPLLLSSTKLARIFAPYLVSRGFTWASVNLIDTYMEMEEQMYEQPLDILFALEQAASNPPEGLEGMIDADRAGAIGYSFDGYNALAMSGARIDPAFYLSQCESPDAKKSHELSSFSCKPARDWDAFTAGAGEPLTSSEDGLWQPLTDERILAVIPMACEGWWLFGEQGLAAVDRPVLILDGTTDELYQENAQIFQYLGTADKGLVSFIGKGHMMIYDPQQVARMAHFAAAFFGYYLQGQEDLGQYFSEDFVDRHVDIHWGVYRGVHVPKE
jgi:predicted dienelactone hydrolase